MQQVFPEQPDTVFGGDAAAELLHQCAKCATDRHALRLEPFPGPGGGFQRIDVDIAIAEMAEPDHFQRRKLRREQGFGAGDKVRQARGAHRDVVFVGLPGRQRIRDVLAQAPEIAGLGRVLRQHAVAHQTRFAQGVEYLQGLLQVVLARDLHFDQGVTGRRGGEGSRQAVARHHPGQGGFGKEFTGGETALAPKGGEDRGQRREGGRAQHQHGRGRRWWSQCEGGRADHAQGAFRADEELAQIVAAVVLDEAPAEFEQFARARHHRQTQHPVAGHAVAQHPDAAGVGGDVAADLARSRGREIHRVIQPGGLRRGLDLCRDRARFTGEGGVLGVHRADAAHAVEGNHQLAPGRHCAAAESGATATGHESDAFAVGELHDRLHLGARRR